MLGNTLPNVSSPNQQANQLLDPTNAVNPTNPNLPIAQLLQSWKQGTPSSHGFISGNQPHYPQGGMGGGTALSPNPMMGNQQMGNQQAMIAALQGQRPNG